MAEPKPRGLDVCSTSVEVERNCPVKPMNPGRSKRMEPVVSLPGPRHEIHHRADNKHLRSSVQIHTDRCHESSSLVRMILLEVFLLIQNSSKFWLNKMHAPRLAECLWMSQEKPADSFCTPSQAEELRICPLLVPSEFLCSTLCFLPNCFWITSLGCGANLGQMG